MGRDGLGKQWINFLLRTRKLAWRTLEDTCRVLPSIFDRAEKGKNSQEKQKEQKGLENVSCIGLVDIVSLGQGTNRNQGKT